MHNGLNQTNAGTIIDELLQDSMLRQQLNCVKERPCFESRMLPSICGKWPESRQRTSAVHIFQIEPYGHRFGRQSGLDKGSRQKSTIILRGVVFRSKTRVRHKGETNSQKHAKVQHHRTNCRIWRGQTFRVDRQDERLKH